MIVVIFRIALLGKISVGRAPALGRFRAQNIIAMDDDPTVIVELEEDFLGQDLLGEHPALALLRQHARANARQGFLEGAVGIVLVSKAALEPAAPASDLGGVERRLL